MTPVLFGFSFSLLLSLVLVLTQVEFVFGANESNGTLLTIPNETEADVAASLALGANDTDSKSQKKSLQVDKFGIEMLYPTKTGGQEWYMNMLNPTSDTRFNPQDYITKNSDGSWKIRSDKVRMYVSTTNGYSPRQITSESGQSEVAQRGFMSSPQDWRDVEITGYVKLNKFTENDNFVWYTRGGKHTESDPCQGSSYKGNLFYHGETQFAKEQWHVSYAKSPTIAATNSLEGKWIGFKFVAYNFLTSDGNHAVKLENWIDSNSDGRSWEKVYEGADAGKWGRAGTECKVKADEILSWAGPLATFRWDFAPDVDFKDLSVREITGENGTINGISYFIGSKSSSNVPEFSNTESQNIPPYTVLPSEAQRQISGGINSGNGSWGYAPGRQGDGSSGNGEIIEQIRASAGNIVYVIFVQGDEDNTDVYLKVSQDGGATFDKTINLSNNPASLSYNAQLVANERGAYVVWEDDDGISGNSDIFYISLSDGGKTLGKKINLSNDPSGSGKPILSVFGSNVFVAWTGTSPDNTDILLTHSSDGGDSFSKPQNVSNDPEISFNPILSMNGTNLVVQWTGQDNMGALNTKRTLLPNILEPTNYANLESTSLTNETNSDSEYTFGQNTSATSINKNNMTSTDFKNQTSQLPSPSSNSTVVPVHDNATASNGTSPGTSGQSSEQSQQPKVGRKTVGDLNNISSSHVGSNNTSEYSDPAVTGQGVINSVNQAHNNTRVHEDSVTSQEEMESIIILADKSVHLKYGQNIGEHTVKANNSSDPSFLLSKDGQEDTYYETGRHEYEQIQQFEFDGKGDYGPKVVDQETSAQSSHGSNSHASSMINNIQDGSTNQQEPFEQQRQEVKDGQLAAVQNEKQFLQQGQKKDSIIVSSEQRQHQASVEGEQVKTEEVQQARGERLPDRSQVLAIKGPAASQSQTERDDQRNVAAERELEKIKAQAQAQAQAQALAQTDAALQHAREEKQRKQEIELSNREQVQILINDANKAFVYAQDAIEIARLANEKAKAALSDYTDNKQNNQHQEANQQATTSNDLPPPIEHLLIEAKIADAKASAAVEKYNELRKAAEKSAQEFNARFVK